VIHQQGENPIGRKGEVHCRYPTSTGVNPHETFSGTHPDPPYPVFCQCPDGGVGQNRFYLQNRLGLGDVGTLFSAFKPGYMNVVKTVFIKNIYIVLWSMLFLIPGIIKTFEYFMVEYILAENPHMDSARAIEISRQMTQGQKMDMFILGLSFIGWILLSVMSCGIGFLFLTPYMEATYAELYTVLREKAILEGTVSIEELTGVAAPAAF
jgi:uncharacterized membrane protein